MVMSVCVDLAIRALSVMSLSHEMMIHVSMAVSVTTQWICELIRWIILLISYMRMTMFFAMYYTSMTLGWEAISNCLKRKSVKLYFLSVRPFVSLFPVLDLS